MNYLTHLPKTFYNFGYIMFAYLFYDTSKMNFFYKQI